MTVNQTDGDVFYGADVKALGKIHEISTSSNLTVTNNTAGSTSGSFEFSEITSANLGNSDYLKIVTQGQSFLNRALTDGTYIQITVEIKEIGGSYGTLVNARKLGENDSSNGSSAADWIRTYAGFEYIHTLTAGEKSNGCQVKITITATSDDDDEATFTHYQSYLQNFFA